jgi:peptidoglycan/LPS O-acetylase OafA/YrhL
VVLFHLFGNGRVSGGIDIFLAVSGFLFTGMLLREAAAAGGRVDPLKYYGRLIRRILVPAALVIAATLLIGLIVSPVTQHSQLWAEARASLLYFENIELINSQLAYGAAGPETSPFQHFWSLSVQGQFYIVWPAMAIIAVLIARRLRTSAARIMGILIGVVFVASFVWAIYVGSYNQDEAYLMTTTRAWELAFGGLLALAGGTIRLPQPFRAPAGWLGLAMIATTGFLLDGAELFPGPWALYPLAGLSLVLISAGPTGGKNDPKWSATRFLSNKPLAWIGDHAYGLYLWHWPLLIYYMEMRDREAIGWRGALVILVVTIILAMLTYRFIEQPLKARQNTRTAVSARRVNKVVVGTTAAGLVMAGLAMTALAQPTEELDVTFGDLDADIYPGAAVHFRSDPPPEAEVFPPIEDARQYRPQYALEGCGQVLGDDPGTDEIVYCEDDSAPEHPTATIVLAGGSHAGHLEETFRSLAGKYGWEVLVVVKSSCVFGLGDGPDPTMCNQWNHNFVTWLTEHKVDLVVTPGTRLDREGQATEYIYDTAPTWWQWIADTDTELLLVRGTPRAPENIPDCLAEGGTPQECGPPKERFADQNPLTQMPLPDGVHAIDVNPYVCPQFNNPDADNCDAIVGNMLVWRDKHHFTSPFSQSLAPGYETEMEETVPHLLR